VHLKNSFGTAIKIFGHSGWANLSAYAKLSILAMAICYHPAWMQQYFQQNTNPTAVNNASASQTPKSAAHRIVWPWQ
jgi:hypothetical protein